MCGGRAPHNPGMTTVQSKPPAMLEMLFDAPLYQAVQLEADASSRVLRGLRITAGQRLDRHCPACGKSTTWTVAIAADDERNAKIEQAAVIGSGRGGPPQFNWESDFHLRLYCARQNLHQCKLFFAVEAPPVQLVVENRMANADEKKPLPPTKILKIGQYPSLADIQLGTLKEYEEGMTVQQRKEFVRAINTSAHGFNVAACVHYRRVFESVLFEARDAKLKADGTAAWPEYEKLRTDERIAALKEYLPQFMVEHPHLYGILSKGVHELTEEECGEAMPVLRQAIELMIQDKVDAIRKEKRRAVASTLLAQTVDKHK